MAFGSQHKASPCVGRVHNNAVECARRHERHALEFTFFRRCCAGRRHKHRRHRFPDSPRLEDPHNDPRQEGIRQVRERARPRQVG